MNIDWRDYAKQKFRFRRAADMLAFAREARRRNWLVWHCAINPQRLIAYVNVC